MLLLWSGRAPKEGRALCDREVTGKKDLRRFSVSYLPVLSLPPFQSYPFHPSSLIPSLLPVLSLPSFQSYPFPPSSLIPSLLPVLSLPSFQSYPFPPSSLIPSLFPVLSLPSFQSYPFPLSSLIPSLFPVLSLPSFQSYPFPPSSLIPSLLPVLSLPSFQSYTILTSRCTYFVVTLRMLFRRNHSTLSGGSYAQESKGWRTSNPRGHCSRLPSMHKPIRLHPSCRP